MFSRGKLLSRKELINMPNKDGSGPEGKGPKTGRGQGRCGGCGSRKAETGEGKGPGLRRKAENKGQSND